MVHARDGSSRPKRGNPGRGLSVGYRKPHQAGDLVAGAMRSLGVPSVRLTKRVQAAWDAAADEAWRDHAALRRLEGGVLEIGVRSAALRDELVNFHRDRLLDVMRTALPNVSLVGLRFVNDEATGESA